MKAIIAKAVGGADLDADEMERAMNTIFGGDATPAQIAALVVALRIKGETADELAIKNNAGVVTRYKKADIKLRQQMKLSIMPAGLVQAMSPDDLVDLIEYLGSLKKK